jgi:hypothetical protein
MTSASTDGETFHLISYVRLSPGLAPDWKSDRDPEGPEELLKRFLLRADQVGGGGGEEWGERGRAREIGLAVGQSVCAGRSRQVSGRGQWGRVWGGELSGQKVGGRGQSGGLSGESGEGWVEWGGGRATGGGRKRCDRVREWWFVHGPVLHIECRPSLNLDTKSLPPVQNETNPTPTRP